MPSSVGPNPSGDSNLVLAYDTGDTINSYKGEPTTNICTGVAYSIYDSGATNYRNQTSPLPPAPGYEVVKVVANTPGTYGQSILWRAPYATNVMIITNSVYAWLESGTYVQVGQHWWPWNYGSPQYIPTGKWARISETYTINEGNSYGSAAMVYSTDGVAYFAMPQYEIKPHITPFVGFDQTRSVTQGLLPIISNTSLDLSNVSFDSNAQIIWDGTNDYIDVSSFSSLEIVDDVTVEAVIKANTSNLGSVKVIANKYSGTGWEFILGTSGNFIFGGRNGDGTYYSSDSGVVIADNTYHHIVGIKTGLYWRTYVDGVLKSTVTAGSVGTLYNTTAMQLGREGNAYYTGMNLDVFKVYNRALTSAEIQQNYKQYKSRFNLS